MERVDVLLYNKGLFPSRQKALEAIKNGFVSVDGRVIKKASEKLNADANITIIGDTLKYVSRGGFKLERAIKQFGLNLIGATVLDMGSSTGGFTDCALQNGAKKVYSVDIGSCQLATQLQGDGRVVSMENTDVRNLPRDIFDECQFIVADISFVSIAKILLDIKENVSNQTLVILIKPQFECGVQMAKKTRGIIKDYNTSKQICDSTLEKIKAYGFDVIQVADSPIKGGDGNSEFIAMIKKS